MASVYPGSHEIAEALATQGHIITGLNDQLGLRSSAPFRQDMPVQASDLVTLVYTPEWQGKSHNLAYRHCTGHWGSGTSLLTEFLMGRISPRPLVHPSSPHASCAPSTSPVPSTMLSLETEGQTRRHPRYVYLLVPRSLSEAIFSLARNCHWNGPPVETGQPSYEVPLPPRPPG